MMNYPVAYIPTPTPRCALQIVSGRGVGGRITVAADKMARSPREAQALRGGHSLLPYPQFPPHALESPSPQCLPGARKVKTSLRTVLSSIAFSP